MFKEFPDDDAKVDDFLNEFRQKISDRNIENPEEKKEEMKRSRSIFLGILGGVVLAGIVGKIILTPQYAIESEKEIPVIRRPQTAIRVQPNEPGGMDIPNQDKSVYNIIEKKDDAGIENLLPPPEAPKLPVITAQEQPETDTRIAAVDTTLPEAEKIIQKVENAPTTTTAEIIKKAEEQVSAMPEPEQKAVQPAAAPVQAQQETKPIVKAETAKTDAEKTQKQAKSAVKGDWQIQLMSSPNKPAVEKAKGDLGKKYKISHLPFEIESAVLDMNKTFYRLKVGAFKNRTEADKVCGDIKALGGTCIVKKK